MEEAQFLLNLGYLIYRVQSANISRWLISSMHRVVQMVCWNQNKMSKCEPKLNILRKKQEQSKLFVRQMLYIGIFNWLLFILPGSKPAIFIQLLESFLPVLCHWVVSTDEMQSEELSV